MTINPDTNPPKNFKQNPPSTKWLKTFSAFHTQTILMEVIYRIQNFSNAELEQEAFKIVILTVAYGNIYFLLSNM